MGFLKVRFKGEKNPLKHIKQQLSASLKDFGLFKSQTCLPPEHQAAAATGTLLLTAAL